MGTQDDFEFAREFRSTFELEHVDMLWDPNFATWSALGVQVNSQMMLVEADLSGASELIFGFDDDTQLEIIDFIMSSNSQAATW